MPYIKQEDRVKFDSSARDIAEKATCGGDLNYAFTVIVQEYINKKGLRYANLNEVIGMLECCKLELYRRVVGNYEDSCVIKNGDVNLIKPVVPAITLPDTTTDTGSFSSNLSKPQEDSYLVNYNTDEPSYWAAIYDNVLLGGYWGSLLQAKIFNEKSENVPNVCYSDKIKFVSVKEIYPSGRDKEIR